MEATGKERRRGKAAVVGGSIAGLCCAHALISAGWDAAVIEKSTAPLTPSRSPTGAGLGLDPQSREILVRWISDPQLHQATFPLSTDLNRATDSGNKTSKTLTRDENFNFRAAHWADLHSMLYKELPPGLILWGHQFISFQTSMDKSTIGVKCRVAETGEIVEIEVDLLVAADGCLSAIRQKFLPNLKLRYAGYCAWRGVLDYSDKEDSDLILGMRKAYPELGNCLYFDLARDTHAVLYELKNKRLNWIWYVNQPEPESKGRSVTMKVNRDALHNMLEEANKVWVPQLARLMQDTTDPFINIIYDCDPLPHLHWEGKIVLVGDAAHPTTPHGLRSTNMSVVDAHVLGKCLERYGLEDLEKALEEFQAIRLPVVSEQVLYARKLGRVKQGLDLIGDVQLHQRGMPYFDGAPSSL
ncbi:FAD/NAD(P)-binding oxidoreductase family protein [Carex rostrata]